jgi:hypothetical protein
VRVWLSWQVYQHDAQKMYGRFQTFLGRCQFHGLHVIAVLWDNDFHEPDQSSIGGALDENYQKWIRAPGFKVIKEDMLGHLDDRHRQYIVDMVTAAQGFPNLLLWDAMNEPEINSATRQDTWILETLQTIKDTDGNAKTCVTPPFWNPLAPEHVALAADGPLDVMSFNFYGYGRRDIEGLCDNIVQTCANAGLSQTKPIIAAEAGRIGECMYYPEAINLLTGVPAQYTGNPNPTEDGIGFCLFSANVGQKWEPPILNGVFHAVNFPVVEMGDGLFYAPNYDDPLTGDRFVRDYYPTYPQGYPGPRILVTGTLLEMIPIALHPVPNPPLFQAMPTTDPNYIPQFVPLKFDDGTARCEVAEILNAAATNASTCGLANVNWVQVDQEINLATWIYTWSFGPDWVRYHLPTKLVPYPVMTQMWNDRGKLYSTKASYPAGSGAWSRDPNFILAYQRLFGAVHTWWQAGNYDVWY